MATTRTARMLAGLACSALVWIGTSTSAQARFTVAEALDSVPIARGYWHSLRPGLFDGRYSGCRPRAVELDFHGLLGDAMATADLGGCADALPTIDLELPTIRTLSDRHGCAVITHEFGHLLGFRHVHPQTALMSGAPSDGRKPPRHATWRRAWRRCENRL